MFVLGIMLIIFSVIKRKNQAKLSQITGKVDNVALANICCNCGLNITSGLNECPRCHTKLNNNQGGYYGTNNR